MLRAQDVYCCFVSKLGGGGLSASLLLRNTIIKVSNLNGGMSLLFIQSYNSWYQCIENRMPEIALYIYPFFSLLIIGLIFSKVV